MIIINDIDIDWVCLTGTKIIISSARSRRLKVKRYGCTTESVVAVVSLALPSSINIIAFDC